MSFLYRIAQTYRVFFFFLHHVAEVPLLLLASRQAPNQLSSNILINYRKEYSLDNLLWLDIFFHLMLTIITVFNFILTSPYILEANDFYCYI